MKLKKSILKIIIFSIITTILLFNFVSCSSNSGATGAKFTDEKGATVSLAQYKGDVVVVMFWASWCPGCRMVVPYLDKLTPGLAEKGVKVLAVSNDQSVAEAKKYLSQLQQLNMTVLYDLGGAVADSWGVRGIPTCFILDKKGKINKAILGCNPNEVVKISTSLLSPVS